MVFVDFELLEEGELVVVDEPENGVEKQYMNRGMCHHTKHIKLRSRQPISLWQNPTAFIFRWILGGGNLNFPSLYLSILHIWHHTRLQQRHRLSAQLWTEAKDGEDLKPGDDAPENVFGYEMIELDGK